MTSHLGCGCVEFDRICNKIYETYPNACVLWVEKIYNPELEMKHSLLLETLRTRYEATTVIELFHGTNSVCVDSIVKNGFKVVHNTRSAFGIGTYFSSDARYSMIYAVGNEVAYMFLCDVILGTTEHVRGAKQIIADTGLGPPMYIKRNHNEDRIMGPITFVSPYDEGGIPRYLIAFHKNAS